MSNTDFTGPRSVITPRQPASAPRRGELIRVQQTIIRAQRVLSDYAGDERTAEDTLAALIEILGETEDRPAAAMPPQRRRFDWR